MHFSFSHYFLPAFFFVQPPMKQSQTCLWNNSKLQIGKMLHSNTKRHIFQHCNEQLKSPRKAIHSLLCKHQHDTRPSQRLGAAANTCSPSDRADFSLCTVLVWHISDSRLETDSSYPYFTNKSWNHGRGTKVFLKRLAWVVDSMIILQFLAILACFLSLSPNKSKTFAA